MNFKLFVATLLFLFSSIAFSQITVDDSQTVEELVIDVLINNACTDITNISSSTGTDFGDVNGIGSFDANGSDFPFKSGVVLSSGNLQNAPGPNFDLNSDGGFGWPGDADLEAFTSATNTGNASSIQFDFVPEIDVINFNFIMASEEYNQLFECTFSDAFAFILTDQITNISINLAVLPGTSIPIEVTNIHPDVPGLCGAVNEEFFDRYNFEPFFPAADAAIDFNGQIVPLTATGPVVPGNPYTIKLVVADESDTAYDIAVFIEAGSFDFGAIDLGEDILLGSGDAQCEGTIITLDSGVTDPDATFEWFKDGVLIPGENSSTLDVSTTGVYTVEVTFGAAECVGSDDILVEFFANPEVDLGEDQIICDGDSTILDATPINIADLDNPTYQWFLDGVELVGETSNTLTVTEDGIYTAQVTASGCVGTDEASVGFFAKPEFDLGEERLLCDEQTIILDATPTNIDDLENVTYQWFQDGVAIAGETNSTLSVTDPGLYAAEVTGNGCLVRDEVNVVPFSFTVDLGEDVLFCDGDSFEIVPIITGGNPADATYLWSTGETSSTITVNETGTYSVEVTISDCTEEDSITVTFQQNPIVELGEDQLKCAQDIIVLNASPSNFDEGEVTYAWSVDGGIISGETESTLDVTEEGIYSVTVTAGECTGSDSIEVSFYENKNCIITQGISINNDGLNDNLDLEFLNEKETIVNISIFNRDGRIVYEKENYVNEWFGQTNDGNDLPVGTYYYVINLLNNDPVTGWIYINK